MNEAKLAADKLKQFAIERKLGRPDEILEAKDHMTLYGIGCRWGEVRQAVAFGKHIDPKEVKRLVEEWG